MNCEYVREAYGVPACIGRRVEFDGQPGTISADRGNYIGVNFDTDKPGVISNCHPIYKIKYLDEVGIVRKPTKSQVRYQRYLKVSDCFDGFMHFLAHESDGRKGEI